MSASKVRTIRVQKFSEQGKESDLKHSTPQERLAMMWQLTLDAWTFKGGSVVKS